MRLDRIDDYPQFSDWQPQEFLPIQLPNDDELHLRARFYTAVVPIIHDPTGAYIVHEEGKPTQLAPNATMIGTGFSVHPKFGIFLTAAHLVPETESEARTSTSIAVFFRTPGGKGVVIPLIGIEADRENDVAIGMAGVTFQDFDYPCLPICPEPFDLSEVVLVAAGYPGTAHSEKRVDIWPATYIGESSGERLNDRFTVPHLNPFNVPPRKEYLHLAGDFIRVPMKALGGMSGGPVCAFNMGQIEGRRRVETERVTNGRVVGIMSWGEDDGDPMFARGYFADVSAALRLKVPHSGDRTCPSGKRA